MEAFKLLEQYCMERGKFANELFFEDICDFPRTSRFWAKDPDSNPKIRSQDPTAKPVSQELVFAEQTRVPRIFHIMAKWLGLVWWNCPILPRALPTELCWTMRIGIVPSATKITNSKRARRLAISLYRKPNLTVIQYSWMLIYIKLHTSLWYMSLCFLDWKPKPINSSKPIQNESWIWIIWLLILVWSVKAQTFLGIHFMYLDILTVLQCCAVINPKDKSPLQIRWCVMLLSMHSACCALQTELEHGQGESSTVI